MVAGRRFRGQDEERSSQHQARCSGDLGVEAVVDDRLRPGETRGLGAGVESGRQVDEEDDPEAEQAEYEDGPPQATALGVVQHGEGEGRGEQRHRYEQVGVRLAGGPGVDGGRRRRDEPGVAGMPDLDCAVLDELRREQAGGGADDGEAGRPLRREHGAGASRRPLRFGGRAQQPPFEQGQAAEEEGADRAQPAAEATSRFPSPTPDPGEPRPGALQLPIDSAIDCPGRLHRLGQGTPQALLQALPRPLPSRPRAPSPRCYHRASLRLLFRSLLCRAREGLFHAPIPAVLAGRPRLLRFISSPLHKATLTLRPWHEASP
jgi:hypothetical protein